MKTCKKCGNKFPSWEWVDGKKRVYSSRKFCFECSPYGVHNTRDLTAETKKNKSNVYKRLCKTCGKEYNAQNRKDAQCYSCYFKRREKQITKKVQGLVGTSCWLCGCNRYWGNLNFHHINPDNKLFGLTTRELVGHRWEKVTAEIGKCVLLCCRCHGEVHGGLIPEKEIKRLHQKHWDK